MTSRVETFEENQARWVDKQAAEARVKLRFNPSITARLVTAVGKQPLKGNDALADDLERALRGYEIWKDVNDQPAFGKMQEWLSDAVKDAKRLLKRLSHIPDDDYAWLDKLIFRATSSHHDFSVIRGAIEANQTIETIFEGILKSNWFGADRIGGPSAEHWLIGKALPEIYENHFGKALGFSRDKLTNMPIGPGIRFLKESLSIMGVLTEDGKPFGPNGIEYYLKKRREELPR
jgi:hypothetical protein